MKSLLTGLSKNERRALSDDLNYLNMGEIQAFCDAHEIPYAIYFETPGGRWRKTGELDRKGVVLNRIRHFLNKGTVLYGRCWTGFR